MGWYIEPEQSIEDLKALSSQERISLTWEQAENFVAPDTLELTEWSGLKNLSLTPFEALMRLSRIQNYLESTTKPQLSWTDTQPTTH
jgi:hypothetical protein